MTPWLPLDSFNRQSKAFYHYYYYFLCETKNVLTMQENKNQIKFFDFFSNHHIRLNDVVDTL